MATTTKIQTIEQARAAIAKIRSKNTIEHHETVEANNIEAAIDQVTQRQGMLDTERMHDAQGNATLRDQAVRQREEWEATRMTPLARRLSGIDD